MWFGRRSIDERDQRALLFAQHRPEMWCITAGRSGPAAELGNGGGKML